jgi:hypothetical protein
MRYEGGLKFAVRSMSRNEGGTYGWKLKRQFNACSETSQVNFVVYRVLDPLSHGWSAATR